MSEQSTYCYVAKRQGKAGAYAACVDTPERAKDTAKFIAKIVREGGYVERIPVDDARKALNEWLACKEASKSGTLL